MANGNQGEGKEKEKKNVWEKAIPHVTSWILAIMLGIEGIIVGTTAIRGLYNKNKEIKPYSQPTYQQQFYDTKKTSGKKVPEEVSKIEQIVNIYCRGDDCWYTREKTDTDTCKKYILPPAPGKCIVRSDTTVRGDASDH